MESITVQTDLQRGCKNSNSKITFRFEGYRMISLKVRASGVVLTFTKYRKI